MTDAGAALTDIRKLCAALPGRVKPAPVSISG